MKKQNEKRLKFYADTPDGIRNKYFVFCVKNFDHAIDLSARFVQEYGFKIRAAFFQPEKGFSVRFDNRYNLNEWQCTVIEKYDLERLLEIAKGDIDKMNGELFHNYSLN